MPNSCGSSLSVGIWPRHRISRRYRRAALTYLGQASKIRLAGPAFSSIAILLGLSQPTVSDRESLA